MSYYFQPTTEIVLSSTSSDPYSIWKPSYTVPGVTNVVSTSDVYLSPTSVLSVFSPTILTPDRPIISTINLTYTEPLYGLYQDLSSDPDIQNKITKYLHKLALDKWLTSDLIDILNYFKVSDNGNVDLINNMNDYKPDNYKKYNSRQIEQIIDFIERYFLSENIMKRILKRYVDETDTKWTKLSKNTYFIRQAVSNKIMKLIRQAFDEKRKFGK